MTSYQYQENFSTKYEVLYNYSERQQKASKIIAVLMDYFNEDLKKLKLLDVGASTGIMTKILSEHFSETIGIDIDEHGIKFAKKCLENEHLSFCIGDGMDIKFPDNYFDVVNCSHIYEHVPDSKQLMNEIFRIFKTWRSLFFCSW